jgi:hypothetical protein
MDNDNTVMNDTDTQPTQGSLDNLEAEDQGKTMPINFASKGRTDRSRFYGRKTGCGFGGVRKEARIARFLVADRVNHGTRVYPAELTQGEFVPA